MPAGVLQIMSFPKVVCIVGRSDSGKTTLIEKLIPELTRLGFRVGTIKHGAHGSEMDHPGKDSWRHLQAGSMNTVLSSPQSIGMVKAVDHDYSLDELLFLFSDIDIVLAEGYKKAPEPKIEVFRSDLQEKPLELKDNSSIACVSDTKMETRVPVFGMEEIANLAGFLIDHFKLTTG